MDMNNFGQGVNNLMICYIKEGEKLRRGPQGRVLKLAVCCGSRVGAYDSLILTLYTQNTNIHININ